MFFKMKFMALSLLAFLIFSAKASHFEMAYSGGTDCSLVMNSFNESIRKTGGINSSVYDEVNNHMKRVVMDDDLSLNRIAKRMHNKVNYYKLDIDFDGEDEIVLETKVLIDRSYKTNRQYYLLDGTEARIYKEKHVLRQFLESIPWIFKEGLDIPKMVNFPYEFRFEDMGVVIENSRPYLIKTNSGYYIMFEEVDYFTLLKIEEGKAEGHCLFKNNPQSDK